MNLAIPQVYQMSRLTEAEQTVGEVMTRNEWSTVCREESSFKYIHLFLKQRL